MAGANDLLPSHRINGFGYDRLSRRPEIRSLTSRPMLSLTVNYVGVGLLFFNEHLSPKNVVGIAFCLVGLALIAPR